jgi:putative flavoprotein involved in K+ transport
MNPFFCLTNICAIISMVLEQPVERPLGPESMALTGSDHQHQILIIGAGAAGLALGHELKQRGIPCLILERGSAAGDSWRRMPAGLRLVSPWRANWLPGTRSDLFPRHREISRTEYHRYLQDYAGRESLPVITDVYVKAVSKDENGLFRLTTSRGEFRTRFLVNATGYFSKPFVPDISGATECDVPQLHVADYRDPSHVNSLIGRRQGLALIVGKRLSAGQTMLELVDAGLEVALSHRSRIEFGPGPISWWLFFRIFPEIEAFKLWLRGPRARGFDVKMQGGRTRRLIRSGVVKTFPTISRFAGRSVIFENGAELQPGVVIYATGFRPALDHLHSMLPDAETLQPVLQRMESVSVPGLFFVGLAHQRNLQSHYLRGIRRDVVLLAEQLGERLRSDPFRSAWLKPSSQSSVVAP